MTAYEITTLQAEIVRLGKEDAGGQPIANKLATSDGLTETWVICETPVLVPMPEILVMAAPAERTGLATYIETDKGFRLLYDSLDNLNVSSVPGRNLIAELRDGGLIGAQTAAAILRLGERRQTRSEELFGRNLTADEVREAL